MKISKKIFACVLTVCMLLTMFAGVLSASAAVAGSATIGSAEINVGEAAEVSVTLNADAAIGGADLYIAFPEEAAVSATVATEGYSLEYLVAGEMAAEGNVDLVEGVAHFILLASDDAFAGATTVEIALTVAGLAEGEYAVAFADGTLIGTTGEVAVAAALTNGAITVIAEVACDHAETKDVVTEAATCAEAGTKNIVCAACDEVITADVEIPATGEHVYVDLICGCGAKKPQNEALADALYSTNMTVSDKFGIYRCFWLQNIKDSSVVYDDFEVVVSKKALDGSSFLYKDEPEITVFDETNYTGNSRPDRDFYYYNFNQVSLYELGVDVTYTLYLYNEGEKVEYYTFEPVTFVSIAKAHYDKYLPQVGTADGEKQVKMGATLLNVAAQAQNYFKNGKENSPLNTFANPLNGVDTQYIADYSTLTALSDPTQDSKLSLRGLQLLATPSLRYWYYNTSSKDAAAVTLTATYTSLNTKNGENGVVTKSLNGANLPGTDGDSADRGLYYFTFDQIALYDGNKTVTLTATDATGTHTFETSLDTFLVNNIGVTSLAGDVYRAIASLSACTRIYFPSY